MSAHAAVHGILLANTAVSGLVGSRIYPSVLPQGVTYPAISYEQIHGSEATGPQAYRGLFRARFQVSIFARDRAGSIALAAAVSAALKRYRGTVAGVPVSDVFIDDSIDLFDPESGVYFIAQEYRIYHR